MENAATGSVLKEAKRKGIVMKKLIKVKGSALIFLTIAGLLGGCAVRNQPDIPGVPEQAGQEEPAPSDVSTEQDTSVPADTADIPSPLMSGQRPSLISNIESSIETKADTETDAADAGHVVPCVESYTIAPDLSNIDNLFQFYLAEDMADKLSQNGFVVYGDAGREFFEIYEMNRYAQFPSFVTVDSMMHTYHLYFSYLLKNTEKTYLSDRLTGLSRNMLENSIAQYDRLKGSEWESAAMRNVAFFTVGTRLLDDNTVIKDYVEDTVLEELDRIRLADGIHESGITGEEEDYTQYKPRGYYEGDAKLEQYFQAMMWYGRTHFTQENPDMDKSALLMTVALSEDAESSGLWESIYSVTSFFSGASDDLGVCEYAPVIREAYGEDFPAIELAGNKDAFERFHAMTASLSAPQINSVPIRDGESSTIPGFRFMGQRFTIDAAIMQQLIYSRVQADSAGNKRMLPDVLDVPAALGSDTALQILEESGAASYEGYTENMEKLRESLSAENTPLWSASLYACWLNTLRPLLAVKGEGYPVFMQNEEWQKKNLECFAGSFTELKHDTILYSKQVIAEMGGWDEEKLDDRGYVEPEPLVYARFAALIDQTAQGLEQYGMLGGADKENLSRLSHIANQLYTISNKELRDETLTDNEYEFIKSYGGNIEHFWYEAAKGEAPSDMVSSQEFPAAVVVDIATDPDGEVLEAATGSPSVIYTVVKVDGKLKIARGSVYSFYQFRWPADDRLTDSSWRMMMGLQTDEEGYYHYDSKIPQPDWTGSYRYRNEQE